MSARKIMNVAASSQKLLQYNARPRTLLHPLETKYKGTLANLSLLSGDRTVDKIGW